MRASEFITESTTSIGDQIQSQLGLKVFNLYDQGNTIVLASLVVGKDKQGQGLGTKAMTMLTDYADEHGKRITLTPGLQDKIQGTTSRGRLVKFYKKFGFKESKGRDIDYALGAGKMYREPKLDEMALPTDWDPAALGHDKSFKSRLQYALERAPKLGGGSSRVALIIPDQGRETVLKIAKNRKGMAQNQAEVDILTDGYAGQLDIVIPMIDYDQQNPQPTWLQTEKANKVSDAKLRKLLHCDKTWMGMMYFTNAVRYMIGDRSPYQPDLPNIKERMFQAGQTEQDWDTFIEYVNEVATLVSASGLLVDDLMAASNWGEYKGRPVVIDLGYTEAVKSMYTKGR